MNCENCDHSLHEQDQYCSACGKKVQQNEHQSTLVNEHLGKSGFKKLFLRLMIVSFSISALMGIIVFIIGDFGELEGQILMTTASFGLYTLAGLCCSILYDKNRHKTISATGMIVSFLSFVFTTLFIWEVFGYEIDLPWRVLLTAVITSFTFAHACLILLTIPKTLHVALVRKATLLLIALVGLLLLYPVYADGTDSAIYFRLLGIVVILDALGTIVTPIANRT